MNGELDRGISCIAFSKFDGGNLLCVVDESNDHVVSLYEWHKGSNGHKLCESKSSCDSVLAVEFHPIEKNSLITIGRGHIHFWDIDGGILTKKVGSFEVFNFFKIQTMVQKFRINMVVFSNRNKRSQNTFFVCHSLMLESF